MDINARKEDSAASITRHYDIRYLNKEENPYQCRECDKIFVNDDHLKKHSKIHGIDEEHKYRKSSVYIRYLNKREYPYQCCGLKKHSKIHEIEKNKGRKCDKSFSTSGELIKHKMIHTVDKSYKCNECDKTFPDNDTFVNHMKIHVEKNSCQCIKCGRTFSEKRILSKHVMKCNGKIHQCSNCPNTYSQIDKLIKHMRIHSGEKQYKCTNCDLAFYNNVNLKSHMKIHTEESLYQCKECDKSFLNISHLASHMKTHLNNSNSASTSETAQTPSTYLNSESFTSQNPNDSSLINNGVKYNSRRSSFDETKPQVCQKSYINHLSEPTIKVKNEPLYSEHRNSDIKIKNEQIDNENRVTVYISEPKIKIKEEPASG